MLPKNRVVTHPGKMPLDGYLRPMGLTQARLAAHIGIAPPVINELCKGKRSVTPKLAILLGAAFATDPEFWTRMQADHDFTNAREEMRKLDTMPGKVKVLEAIR